MDARRQNLNFELALTALKQGARLRRAGWDGPDQFVFLVQGSTFKVNRAPLNQFYEEGTEITYEPHIDIRNQQGSIVPWLASQGDLMANDWEELDE